MKNVELTPDQADAEQQEIQGRGGKLETAPVSDTLQSLIEKSTGGSRFTPREQPTEAEEAIDNNQTVEGEVAAESTETGEDVAADEAQEQETDDAPKIANLMPENLREAFPDKDFDNEDDVNEVLDALLEDRDALGETKKTLESERESQQKLYDVLDNSDETVQLLRQMANGKDFFEALSSIVDIEARLSEMKEDDPEKYKQVLKEQAKREARLEQEEQQRQKLEQDYADNESASQENITTFQKEKEFDNTQKEEFLGSINKHFANIVHGKVTPDFLQVMYRGLQYEKDVEQAKEKGKIEGKNEKINAERQKKMGDGLPITRGGKPKQQPKASRGKRAIASIVRDNQSTFS